MIHSSGSSGPHWASRLPPSVKEADYGHLEGPADPHSAWALLFVPALLWLKESVPFLVFVSVYANFVGHWAAWEAARPKRKPKPRRETQRREKARRQTPSRKQRQR